jgi:hypothetical protein
VSVVEDFRLLLKATSGFIEFLPIEAAIWLWRPSKFLKAIRVQVVR